MWPTDPAEQQKLAVALVTGRSEHRRVDLKSTLSLEPRRAIVELIRDISAIANTDEDWGYIVVGAQRGKVIGNVEALSDANLERTSEKLSQCCHNYLDPIPPFRLVPLRDPEPSIGAWGVIVIEPSTDQPYMFVRSFSDERDKPAFRSGDWYVRRGDTTDLAMPRDWARVLERRVRRALQPVELEVKSLRDRVAALEAFGEANAAHSVLVARAQTELLPRLTLNSCGGSGDEMTQEWGLRNAGGTPFQVVQATGTWRFTEEARRLLLSAELMELAKHGEILQEVKVHVPDPIVGAGATNALLTTVRADEKGKAALNELRSLHGKRPDARWTRASASQWIHIEVTVEHRITKERAIAEADYTW
jgi:hypothetical protein